MASDNLDRLLLGQQASRSSIENWHCPRPRYTKLFQLYDMSL
jgi:hypothetical protein